MSEEVIIKIKREAEEGDAMEERDPPPPPPPPHSADDEKKRRVNKKGGQGDNFNNNAMRSCHADKCSVDLNEAKQYHRRHKVCEYHAKAQVVVVAGLRQRFCQQCSRFHELGEFDETKRSCRRRLAGHNERRRKSSATSSNPHGAEPLAATVTTCSSSRSQCQQLKDLNARGQVDNMQGKDSNIGSRKFFFQTFSDQIIK